MNCYVAIHAVADEQQKRLEKLDNFDKKNW